MSHKTTILLILLLVFILAFFLRAQETLSGNYLFLKDQGRDMMAVKSIVADKKVTLIGPDSGMQGVFQGPLYYYLLAVPFLLFDGNPIGDMWLMVFLSMLSIGIVYWWVRKLYGEIAALFTAFIFAVSPGASAAATFIWNPHPTIPLVAIYMYFLLKTTSTTKPFYLYAMIGTLGLFFHTEMALGVPLSLATLIYLLLYRRDLFTKQLKHLLLASLIFVGLMSPLILFDLRHDNITSKSILLMLQGKTQGLAENREPYAKVLLGHYVAMYHTWRYSYTWVSSFQVPLILTTLISAVFFSSTDKLLRKILLFPFLIYIVYMLYPYQTWGWYFIGIYPIFILLLGLVLFKIWRYQWGKAVCAIIIAVLLYGSYFELAKNYSRPPGEGGKAKIQGQLTAIDTIYQDAGGKEFNVLIFAPVVLTDNYDYLFWWHGLRAYGYLPGHEKKGTFYLLMEPDPSKPWSYEGWQETVIKTGDIVWTKTLPSGLVLEKRQEMK